MCVCFSDVKVPPPGIAKVQGTATRLMRQRSVSLAHERLLAVAFAPALGHSLAEQLQLMHSEAAWSALASRMAAPASRSATLFSALVASQHAWPFPTALAATWQPPTGLRRHLQHFEHCRTARALLQQPLAAQPAPPCTLTIRFVFVRLSPVTMATSLCWGCASTSPVPTPCPCGARRNRPTSTATGPTVAMEVNAQLAVGLLRLALVTALAPACPVQLVLGGRVACDDSEVTRLCMARVQYRVDI